MSGQMPRRARLSMRTLSRAGAAFSLVGNPSGSVEFPATRKRRSFGIDLGYAMGLRHGPFDVQSLRQHFVQTL